MDHKPLLQERPPAYNLEAGQGDYACGPHGYGAIPAAPPPPPYPYLVTGIPTHHPRVYNIHSRTVTRYPANSIVVVGGCPVCRVGVLEDCFTFLGIFLAIILFPFGLQFEKGPDPWQLEVNSSSGQPPLSTHVHAAGPGSECVMAAGLKTRPLQAPEVTWALCTSFESWT
ncbi:Brain protein I3 [Plecturocebus cupreus]